MRPSGLRLILSYDRLPFKDVLRFPLVLCHPEKCAGGYKLFQKMLRQSGLPPPEIAEYISGHEPMMLLVAAGYGVGFGLESQAALYGHHDVVIRPLAEDIVSASTYIVTCDLPNPPELQRFIERARKVGGKVEKKGDGTAPPIADRDA